MRASVSIPPSAFETESSFHLCVLNQLQTPSKVKYSLFFFTLRAWAARACLAALSLSRLALLVARAWAARACLALSSVSARDI
ncbi:hypothetical protein LZ32DRAFT_326383 [Colletotrichum eremochloae]|nr:hypothetical protein LZ32DRAFT_326383 [Colletotrichum eremochloae]